MDREEPTSPHRFYPLQSCYYNDFFLLRTPVTINGDPAKIKLVNEGCPMLYTAQSIEIKLSDISQKITPLLASYGVKHIDTFYYERAPLFSFRFTMGMAHSPTHFLSKITEVRSKIRSLVFFSQFYDAARALAQEEFRVKLQVEVETELFLVSPNGQEKGSAEVNRITLDNYLQCVDKWQQSKFEFEHIFESEANIDAEPTLAELDRELTGIIEWYKFGVGLKIPTSLLQTIQADYTFTDRRRLEMLTQWQYRDTPTWRKVVDALFKFGRPVLARQLAEKYGIEQHFLEDTSLAHVNQITHDDRTKLEAVERELISKQNEVKQCKSEVVTVRETIDEWTAERSEINSNIESLKTENSHLKHMLRKKTEDLETFKQLYKRNNEHENFLDEIIREKDVEIAGLKKKINEKDIELSKLRARLSKTSEELELKKRELDEKSTEISKLYDELKLKENEFIVQKKLLTASTKKKCDLEEEFAKSLDEKETEISTLEDEVRKTKKELSSLRHKAAINHSTLSDQLERERMKLIEERQKQQAQVVKYADINVAQGASRLGIMTGSPMGNWQQRDELSPLSPDSSHRHAILIRRGVISNGFGFKIKGGAEYNSPLCVKKISPFGAAKNDGRLHVGDTLVEINGKSTSSMLQSDAHKIIREKKNVELVITREKRLENGHYKLQDTDETVLTIADNSPSRDRESLIDNVYLFDYSKNSESVKI